MATTNVGLSAAGGSQDDLVTTITPSFYARATSARASFTGQVSVPVVLYARTGGDNNSVYPSANLSGTVEAVDNFFYIDGAVSIAQQFFSPFGAQPLGFANNTSNRYRSDSYRVSPYIRGVAPGEIKYELRNNNVWTNLSGAPIAAGNGNFTDWIGNASSASATKFGWDAHAEWTEYRYNDQRPIVMQLARFKAFYNVDPEFRVWASGGYEDNRLAFTESNGAIYGGGFEWRPTPRTHLLGSYEHRFFGASYEFSFSHRTPLSSWNVRVARDITNYPRQLATLPAGVEIAGILDNLFLSGFPDPAERQRAIDDFIRERGLTDVLSSPVALYSQQIILYETQSATAGLVGARNSVFFTVFNVRSEPIAGSGNPLPAPFAAGNNNTQTGMNLVWTYRLTPSVGLNATLAGYRTVANAPLEGTTRQGVARVTLSTPLSPRSWLYGGARYQLLRSDVATDYEEAAIFVGWRYEFR
jgi:uncharacterized protein (PEP-CTERM system associated)